MSKRTIIELEGSRRAIPWAVIVSVVAAWIGLVGVQRAHADCTANCGAPDCECSENCGDPTCNPNCPEYDECECEGGTKCRCQLMDVNMGTIIGSLCTQDLRQTTRRD